MKEFKVRVTGRAGGWLWYSKKIGQEFTVTGRDAGGYYIRGEGGYINKSDCVIVEDEMETCAVKGVTYKQLKDITPEAIYKTQPCTDEWSEFYDSFARNYGWNESVNFGALISHCVADKPVWLQWLVDRGFTEKVEEKEKYYTVINGSGTLELYRGKLKKTFPAWDKYPRINKWKLIGEGEFPSDSNSIAEYSNDTMLVHADEPDRYLFIEERFIKVQ